MVVAWVRMKEVVKVEVVLGVVPEIGDIENWTCQFLMVAIQMGGSFEWSVIFSFTD